MIEPAADELADRRLEFESDAGTGDVRGQRALVRRLAAVAVTIGLILGIKACVAEPVKIHSNSMTPTLHDGDVIAVDKMSFRWRDPHRGEIVVAHSPDTDALIVKRVVAVAGDAVGIYDGRLQLNGVFPDEPYANNDRMEGSFYGPVDVPHGYVFLLGDNRFESSDSRHFGFVPVSSITGRLAFTMWPLG